MELRETIKNSYQIFGTKQFSVLMEKLKDSADKGKIPYTSKEIDSIVNEIYQPKKEETEENISLLLDDLHFETALNLLNEEEKIENNENILESILEKLKESPLNEALHFTDAEKNYIEELGGGTDEKRERKLS